MFKSGHSSFNKYDSLIIVAGEELSCSEWSLKDLGEGRFEGVSVDGQATEVNVYTKATYDCTATGLSIYGCFSHAIEECRLSSKWRSNPLSELTTNTLRLSRYGPNIMWLSIVVLSIRAIKAGIRVFSM